MLANADWIASINFWIASIFGLLQILDSNFWIASI
jgi:hypothetical protein